MNAHRFLTTCNACEFRPMAPGQENPSQPGYCAECLAEARSPAVDFDACSPENVRAIRRRLGLPIIDDPAVLADLDRRARERLATTARLIAEARYVQGAPE